MSVENNFGLKEAMDGLKTIGESTVAAVKQYSDLQTKSLEKTILAIFKSKSAIRFAEAYGIINSGAYLDSDKGLNWSFEGSRGTIKMDEEDTEQLRRLMSWCLRWKKKQDKEKTEE